MDAADIREQMMFNLEIQAAYKPGEELVFRAEISRGTKLVNNPGIFHLAGFIRHKVFGFFYHMSKLKNNAQNSSGYNMHRHKTNDKLPPGNVYYKQRDHYQITVIYKLSGKGLYKFLCGMYPPFGGNHSFFGKTLIMF